MSLNATRGGFGRAPAWLLQLASEKKLKWDDVGIWTAISYEWGRSDGLVWVTRTKMAKVLGVSRRTLYRHLDRLEEAGAFKWEDYEGTHGEKRRMMVLRAVDPCASPDTPLCQPRHTPCVTDGPEKKKTPKKKKEEDCEPADAVSLVPLVKEEEDIEEGREETLEERKERARREREAREAREEAAKRAALVVTKGAEAVDLQPAQEDAYEHRKAMSTRSTKKAGRGSSAPRVRTVDKPGVRDAFTTWDDEVKLRWPGGAVRKLDKDTAGIIVKLLQKTDLDGLKAIIRLAVWDWSAIQGSIQPWYTQPRAIPDFKAITYLFDNLASKVGTGVTSSKHRVSEYHRRFIKKIEPQAPTEGLTMAEKFRLGLLG